MTRMGLANEFLEYSILTKNLKKDYWVSGSGTYVYPVTIWDNSIVFQLTCYENIFEDFIKEIVEKYNNVIADGYFWESDGSCPCTLTFKLKEGVR